MFVPKPDVGEKNSINSGWIYVALLELIFPFLLCLKRIIQEKAVAGTLTHADIKWP